MAEPVKAAPLKAAKAPVSRNVTTGKILASPAVRARAEQLNIDLSKVPTEAARVSHADLDAFLLGSLSAQPLASPSPIPLAKPSPATSVTSSDGGSVQETHSSSPPIAGETRHNVTALEAMRARMNDRRSEEKPKLTVLPLIIRALAVTLVDWPQFNARYEDEKGYVARFEDLSSPNPSGSLPPKLSASQKRREVISSPPKT